MSNTNGSPELPARTHADAAALFRRPFAPGAIGFRAMTRVPYNGHPLGGAQIAAYISAQSILQPGLRPRPHEPRQHRTQTTERRTRYDRLVRR